MSSDPYRLGYDHYAHQMGKKYYDDCGPRDWDELAEDERMAWRAGFEEYEREQCAGRFSLPWKRLARSLRGRLVASGEMIDRQAAVIIGTRSSEATCVKCGSAWQATLLPRACLTGGHCVPGWPDIARRKEGGRTMECLACGATGEAIDHDINCRGSADDVVPVPRTADAQSIDDVARANAFYEEEWDTCQPTRTLAAIVKLIVDVRRETAQVYLRRERATLVKVVIGKDARIAELEPRPSVPTLADSVRAAVDVMRAQPGGVASTSVKLADGSWAELRTSKAPEYAKAGHAFTGDAKRFDDERRTEGPKEEACGEVNADHCRCRLVRGHDGNHYDGIGYWHGAGRRTAGPNASSACTNCDGRGYHQNSDWQRVPCFTCSGTGKATPSSGAAHAALLLRIAEKAEAVGEHGTSAHRRDCLKSIAVAAAQARISPEERSRRSRLAAVTRGSTSQRERAEAMHRAEAKKTPEQRAAQARKAWVTRRTNKVKQENQNGSDG